jgi:hypothetical protein
MGDPPGGQHRVLGGVPHRVAEVLLDQQHGQAAGRQSGHGVVDLPHHVGLDALGGLVEHQEPRPRDESAGDRQLLPLTARQEAGGAAQQAAQRGEEVEGLVRAPSPRGPVGVGDDLQVLPGGELPERLLTLRHVGEPAPHPAVGRPPGDVVVAEKHRAGPRRQQAQDGAQQRGLAGAVVPQHGGEGARRDREVDAVHDGRAAVAGGESGEGEHQSSPFAAEPR